MKTALIWITAYVLGSVPFGVLYAHTQNLDLRKHGSRNIGATNVARTLGKKSWGTHPPGRHSQGLAGRGTGRMDLGHTGCGSRSRTHSVSGAPFLRLP